MAAVDTCDDLQQNLSAAAHLIHGSTEGRFSVTYCPGGLSKEEVEGVGYSYGDLSQALAAYMVDELVDGWNDVNGERVFFISNPALGLWACAERLG